MRRESISWLGRTGAAAPLLALLLTSACTTPGTTSVQRVNAARAVDDVWGAENRATRASNGTRSVRGSPAQVGRAIREAMGALGLGIDEARSGPGAVTASHLFKSGSWSWSPTVRAAEEARLKQLMVGAVGAKGNRLAITPGDETLTGTAQLVATTRDTMRISVDFASSATAGCNEPACIMEMPPAALRSAYFEFWTAFDARLAAITAQGRPPSRHARAAPAPRSPAGRAKAPSEWVLPPSGWKPPKK